jgi:hypothetical protein
METNKFYIYRMQNIVKLQGGFRENDILSKPHKIERSETWNTEHKVLNVVETEPQHDGHRNSFAVDLVTRIICG